MQTDIINLPDAETNVNTATHTLRIDIVNTDATVKRIEINFCAADKWSEAWPDAAGIAEMLNACLCGLIEKDKFAVGSRMTIFKRNVNNPILKQYHPFVIKPEFIINNIKN